MFTWICPKCGKEVPPSYSDCPDCAANAQAPVEPAAAVAAPPPEPSQPAPAPVPDAIFAAPAPFSPPAAPAPEAPQPAGRVSVPGWLLSLLVAAALIIVFLTVVLLRNSRNAAPAQTAAAEPQTVTIQSPAIQSNPILRNLELTGLRLTEDAKQKPFVEFVVVNHSGADLGEISAKVNLRAAAKQEQEPVGTFAFKASLGPYESKDIKAPLDTTLRVYEFPDWQFLRAELVP